MNVFRRKYDLLNVVVIIIGLSAFYFLYLAYMTLVGNAVNRIEREKKTIEHIKENFVAVERKINDDYLTYRLLQLELDNGIINATTYDKAIQNINNYFLSVSSNCNHYLSISEYVICANKTLKYFFYYKPNNTIGIAYSNFSSDCDSNVYLLIDVLRQRGVKGYAIFSPGHAFLAWENEYNTITYYETTTNNNEGSEVDFSNELYLKNLDKTYYSITSPDDIEMLYKAIVFYESGNHEKLESMFKNTMSSNAIVMDIYYYDKLIRNDEIGLNDFRAIRESLILDYNSNIKKIAQIRYHLSNNEIEKASSLFFLLDFSRCNELCYAAGESLGEMRYKTMSYFFKKYSFFYQTNGLPVSTEIFFKGMYYLLVSLSLFFFLFSLKILGRKLIKV